MSEKQVSTNLDPMRLAVCVELVAKSHLDDFYNFAVSAHERHVLPLSKEDREANLSWRIALADAHENPGFFPEIEDMRYRPVRNHKSKVIVPEQYGGSSDLKNTYGNSFDAIYQSVKESRAEEVKQNVDLALCDYVSMRKLTVLPKGETGYPVSGTIAKTATALCHMLYDDYYDAEFFGDNENRAALFAGLSERFGITKELVDTSVEQQRSWLEPLVEAAHEDAGDGVFVSDETGLSIPDKNAQFLVDVFDKAALERGCATYHEEKKQLYGLQTDQLTKERLLAKSLSNGHEKRRANVNPWSFVKSQSLSFDDIHNLMCGCAVGGKCFEWVASGAAGAYAKMKDTEMLPIPFENSRVKRHYDKFSQAICDVDFPCLKNAHDYLYHGIQDQLPIVTFDYVTRFKGAPPSYGTIRMGDGYDDAWSMKFSRYTPQYNYQMHAWEIDVSGHKTVTLQHATEPNHYEEQRFSWSEVVDRKNQYQASKFGVPVSNGSAKTDRSASVDAELGLSSTDDRSVELDF